MTMYAGLDVSDKSTHICVVDGDGTVLRRDVVASDPEVLARWFGKYCPDLTRVVLETGTLSTFLYHGLVERAVPIECICARHAKGVLAARVNKSDVHDAEGLTQIARTGWFKRVHMKASATHIDRAALRIRAQLITTRVAMGNQLRGLLKLFGLRLGAARTPGKRRERLIALYQQRPDLEPLFAPLVASIEMIEEQLRTSNQLLEQRAAADPICARLMSVPGVGPITALTFTASVEDPHRFARSEDVGAYAGLAPRRSQSGERDVKGNISKAGDPMLRRSLYEAANIMLCRVQRPFALQQWGQKIAEAKGNKRARIAVARKLAVLLHSLWLNETEFRWT
ncbi:MAG: IS110 family transposase [Sphingomonas sp.]|nr:IS110 family transposase [Sphingomonas sp.]